MAKEKKGMMIVLSSPSGAGKTTLTKKLAEHNTNFAISISYTTRKSRPDEINGRDYHFIDIEEFNSLIIKNKIISNKYILFLICLINPKKPSSKKLYYIIIY